MPEGREWRLLICGLLAADLAAYAGALIAAASLLAGHGLGEPMSEHYLALIVLAPPVAALLFATQGLYDPQNLFAGPREHAAVLRSCVYGLVALIVLSFAIHLPISRPWIVLSGLLTASTVGATRLGARALQRRLRARGLFTSRALLVGADAQAVAVARQLGRRASGIELVGVLDDYLPVGTVMAGGLKVVGSSARLSEVARSTAARDVIVVPEALPWESLQTVLAGSTLSSEGLRVHLVGGLYDMLAAGVRLTERSGIPLLTVKKAALSPVEATLKRALDCVIAVLMLVLMAPVYGFEALQLWARQSPVLERRPVLDRRGEPFYLLTFSADLATRSALVRKLPSLLNVITGQLSVVGPRPIPADGSKRDVRGKRLGLRPGLTGLWRQVHDPGEQLLLDLYYLRSYSIWLDLQILLTRLRTRLTIHPKSVAGAASTTAAGRRLQPPPRSRVVAEEEGR